MMSREMCKRRKVIIISKWDNLIEIIKTIEINLT